MKKFGMLRKYDDSQEFLLEHPELTCEETANYLVIWCINLEMEEVTTSQIIINVFITCNLLDHCYFINGFS